MLNCCRVEYRRTVTRGVFSLSYPGLNLPTSLRRTPPSLFPRPRSSLDSPHNPLSPLPFTSPSLAQVGGTRAPLLRRVRHQIPSPHPSRIRRKREEGPGGGGKEKKESTWEIDAHGEWFNQNKLEGMIMEINEQLACSQTAETSETSPREEMGLLCGKR